LATEGLHCARHADLRNCSKFPTQNSTMHACIVEFLFLFELDLVSTAQTPN
jgi:hypothetical protein